MVNIGDLVRVGHTKIASNHEFGVVLNNVAIDGKYKIALYLPPHGYYIRDVAVGTIEPFTEDMVGEGKLVEVTKFQTKMKTEKDSEGNFIVKKTEGGSKKRRRRSTKRRRRSNKSRRNRS
jgi:hypothetical protein